MCALSAPAPYSTIRPFRMRQMLAAGGHSNATIHAKEGRCVELREKIVGELRGVMRGLRVVTFCVPPASSQHTRMTPPAPDVSPINNRDENELIL